MLVLCCVYNHVEVVRLDLASFLLNSVVFGGRCLCILKDWGTLPGSSRSLNFSVEADRLAAVEWWVSVRVYCKSKTEKVTAICSKRYLDALARAGVRVHASSAHLRRRATDFEADRCISTHIDGIRSEGAGSLRSLPSGRLQARVSFWLLLVSGRGECAHAGFSSTA